MRENQLYSQAVEAIKNGQNAMARRYLDELVVKEPRNEKAWLLLAEVVMHKNELIDCLEQVITIDPHNKTALEKLQQISPLTTPRLRLQRASQGGLKDQGGKIVLTAESSPLDDTSLSRDILWLEQNQESAVLMKPDINNVRQLIKLDPCNEEAWLQLSKLVSDPAEAADCLRHALAINPYNTVARLRLNQLLK